MTWRCSARRSAGTRGVIGAAAMVTDELFAPRRLAKWLDAGAPAGPDLVAAAHA